MKLFLVNPDVWYIFGETPTFIVNELEETYNKVLESSKLFPDAKKELAGVLDESYVIQHSDKFNEFISSAITTNLEGINGNSTVLKYSNSLEMETQRHWINIQRKGNFNPIHAHSGQYSYVFWHKVPFHFEEENKVSTLKDTGTNRELGDFTFSFVDTNEMFSLQHGMNNLQKNRSYLSTIKMGIDNKRENYFCIFPSWLPHSVDPFYSSDENRVSFSGNYEQSSEFNIKEENSLL